MSAPTCEYCGDVAPSGDERNLWISAHNLWFHKLWWRLKK